MDEKQPLTTSGFFYGVIEGFYGHQWSWSARAHYAAFLSELGYDCYIYAPKGDPFLRSRWREDYPEDEWIKLLELVDVYHRSSVRFGVGLSPVGLNTGYSSTDRNDLLKKIDALNELNIDILCILFDDVEGNHAGLANDQSAIINDIVSASSARHFAVCPTYYSFDPVLETVFGEMPPHYLEDLGNYVPASVDIFWTGNKVISTEYTRQDMEEVSQLLGRKPLLWDNYPVNDGRLTSNFLNLRPYLGRPVELRNCCSGHIVNPMNQPFLSKIPLQSLAEIYQPGTESKIEFGAMERLGNSAFSTRLQHDIDSFQDRGVTGLSVGEKNSLIDIYRDFNNPAADEICEWLQGYYQFDPECLTS